VIDPSPQGVIYAPMQMSRHVEITNLSFWLGNSALHQNFKILITLQSPYPPLPMYTKPMTDHHPSVKNQSNEHFLALTKFHARNVETRQPGT
jgi:hypothetical protein